MEENRWLDWAIEPQSLAQAGLTYGKGAFDLERYTRIREIAAEMLPQSSGLPFKTAKGFSAMRPAIRRRSSARAPRSSRRTASCSCRRRTAAGRCPAAGAM